MNIQHITHAVMCEPWCILPSVHASIRQIIQERWFAESPADVPKRAPGVGACGNAVDVESMQVEDGLAIIPVSGVMARNVSAFKRGSGVVDMADVMSDLEWAANSNDVSTILLNMDTPGGTVNGTPELSSSIQSAAQRKGVYAFTSGMMCSAGIWAGTKAHAVFAAPSATLGSIGVYMPWEDSSAYLAKQGIKVDVISSGKFKGMGEPGTSLTPEQRALLQDRVDGLASDFFESVALARRNFSAENMQGQVFTGKEAVKNGLADGNYDSIAEVIRALGFDSRAFIKRQNKPQDNNARNS